MTRVFISLIRKLMLHENTSWKYLPFVPSCEYTGTRQSRREAAKKIEACLRGNQ